MKTLMIAHRGDTINFPENTIEAFESSFEKGADGIELDLQYQDGNLIIVHDYLYDKTKKYPLLSEVLEKFSSRGRIEIEVKSMELDFLTPLKNLLHRYKNADIEITTSVYPLVSYLRSELPRRPLGIIFPNKEFEEWMTKEFIATKIINWMKMGKANRVHIPSKILNEYLVNYCHKNNFIVHSHIYRKSTKEQIDLYKQFIDLGVDQFTFDDINLIQALKIKD